MIKRIKELNLLKMVKITVGAMISVFNAYGLELDYAVSAGVICLLTIQDTRRETFKVTIKRVIAFAAVTLLCMCFFNLLGYSIISLGAVLAVFTLLCMLFGANEALAMNSVIATHYFVSQSTAPDMMLNELLIFALGAGTGVLLNLFMPVNISRIRAVQKQTDERIKQILKRMSVYILKTDKSDYTGSCFAETDKLLDELKTQAASYLGNSFGGGRDYFLKYAHMRIDQCRVLSRIYLDIMKLSDVPEYGEHISGFLEKMSEEFHEINDAVNLLGDIDNLFDLYSKKKLPESRREFENRALMYHILWDLKYFVKLKSDFAAGLSEAEKQRYW